jgi:predicted nucleic acid-binding protein
VRQFVVDASVALSWYFRDEESALSEQLFAMTDDHILLVPPHWFSEVANGIRMGEIRGRCKEAEAPKFIERLNLMSFDIDTLKPFSQFEMILPLARQCGLTVYDAIYLHVASSNGVPLATLDKTLARAAVAAGVEVIGEGAE